MKNPAINIVNKERITRIKKYTPVVTKVEEWSKEDTVGGRYSWITKTKTILITFSILPSFWAYLNLNELQKS